MIHPVFCPIKCSLW